MPRTSKGTFFWPLNSWTHGVPLVVALNMMDLAEERGTQIDPESLSRTLGCPVVPTVGRKGVGIDRLVQAIETKLEGNGQAPNRMAPFIDSLPEALETPVSRLANRLEESSSFDAKDRARPEALWALLSNLDGDDPIQLPPFEAELTQNTLQEMELKTGELRKAESHARYDYIGRLIQEAEVTQEDRPHTLTERLDSVLLHPIAGPVVLFLVFGLVFQSVYAWAGPFMDGIDALVGAVATGADAILPEGFFQSLVLDGIIAGVGNTIIFLPQILILFLFLGILEDSGYLARAAFLLDRLMSSVGLDGKAFVPMLSSFACAIPGIMATRTIPSRKDRLVTILVASADDLQRPPPGLHPCDRHGVRRRTKCPGALEPGWPRPLVPLSHGDCGSDRSRIPAEKNDS